MKTEKAYHHKYIYMEIVELLASQVRIPVDSGTFTFLLIKMGKAEHLLKQNVSL